MTFGYSSQSLDKANVSTISDWADHLLEQVGAVREPASVSYIVEVKVGPWIVNTSLIP
jgi:hypothetical protein